MERKTILKVFIGVFAVMLLTVGSLLAMALTSGNTQGTTTIITTPQNVPVMLTKAEVTTIAQQTMAGTVTEVELEEIDGKTIYSADVENNNKEYDVQIDPYSGQVLQVLEENDLTTEQVELVKPTISEQQAIQIALSQVQGTVDEVEAEKVGDIYLWDVEIEQGEEDYSVGIDMFSGAIVSIERELEDDDEDDDDEEQPPIPQNTAVTVDQAKAIAAQETGGTVTDFETKKRGGNTLYEVEIKKNGREADVLIDPATGAILEIDWD